MGYLYLRALSVYYRRLQALCELSVTVEKGELFTFLGPSGSGKSTVLLCVAGFIPPTRGRVVLNGEDITNEPPNKRDIGMVFQSYALFPHKTVFGNVAYPLYVRRVSKSEVTRRVLQLLRTVGLGDLDRRMPHQLSGGEQQRVALARALIFRPRLLLLDEPLGSLDKKLREQMQFEVRRIQRESESTVLYVTHDQTEAMTISDRIAVLNGGRVEQVGTPRQVYEDPANPFVADFIGGANFFRVRVVSINGKTCTVESGGWLIKGVPRPPWLNTAGSHAALMARPEHLRVQEGLPAGSNELACRVEQNHYLGDVNVVRCYLPDETLVTVRQPVDTTADSHSAAPACLKLVPERTRLFTEGDLFSRRPQTKDTTQ